MKLLADYHVHTKYSRFFHGKNTIEEMVNTANALGLTEIAITDHGFKHWCKTSKAKLKKAREIIDDINTWSATKVLLGIEADIISEDGTIDVDNETLTMLDILIVGYHRMIKTDFAGYFGTTNKTKAAVAKCTNAFLNAIAKYPVTIVSHLDSILTTDLYKIGCACRDKGVMVEINNRHTKWSKKQVDELISSDCLFVVTSDAHCREDVGRVDNSFDIIKKYQIPTENVVNVEFALSEKSESDIELETYMSIYKDQIEKRQQFKEKNQESLQDKATETTLSKEMEDALMQIAEEKGLVKAEDKIEEDSDEYYINNGSTIEELALIREAQEYLRQNSLKEFESQNEKLEDLTETIDNQEDYEQKLEEVSEAVQETAVPVESAKENDESDVHVETVKDVAEPKVQSEPEKKQQEQSEENKVLSFMQGTRKKEIIPKAKTSTRKVSVEKNEPKTKKRVGGFMNDTAGIVDVAEKNETKKKEKTETKKTSTEENK